MLNILKPAGPAVPSPSPSATMVLPAAVTLIPLFALLLALPMRSTAIVPSARTGLLSVARAVWLPGIGSALSSLGYGAVLAFSSLLATERGWTPVWLNFTAFAFALVAARLFFSHVPDKIGGAEVAFGSVIIEGVGLALIWIASGPVVAAVGAAFTGFGYALVYPGLGVEAVRRAPPQSRGLAMGAYTVFLDLALGLGGPGLGLIAAHGLSTAFLAASLLVLSATGIALRLLASPVPQRIVP